jgi:uncharacterized protein with FMN-binding domain
MFVTHRALLCRGLDPLMAATMPRKLVALSFAAIATVYSAGYLATQGADARLGLSETPSAIVAQAASPAATLVPAPATAAPAPAARRSVARAVPTATPSTAAPNAGTAPASHVASTVYRDGTFEGQGTSRRGGFRVAVTIQAGAITNVAITQSTTQYPASRVAALPGQVVARQSAQVDRVSGATFSTQAFQQAVQQALAQATTPGASALAPAATTDAQGA